VALDSTGKVYVSGYTQSSGIATAGAYQTTLSGSQDALVAQLSADGSSLGWLSYLGGGSSEEATGNSTYDNAGRLTNLQIKDGSGTILGNYTTTYDLASRASSDTIDATTTSYSYDTASELTSAGATNYGYDLAGNRNTTGYATGAANRMTSDGVYSYSYDAEGNRTKKKNGSTGGTWTFGYDNNDQMTWAEDRATDGGTLLLKLVEQYKVLILDQTSFDLIMRRFVASSKLLLGRGTLDGCKADLSTWARPRKEKGSAEVGSGGAPRQRPACAPYGSAGDERIRRPTDVNQAGQL
jgi:hypothetical protein